MKKIKTVVYIFLMALLYLYTPFFAVEANGPEEEGAKDYYVFPIIAYQNETGFQYGIIYLKKSAAPQKDFFQTGLIYTQKDQLDCFIDSEHYFNNGDNLLILALDFEDWPSEFFGIGNEEPDKTGEAYKSVSRELTGSILWKLREGLYVGPTLGLYRFKVSDKEPDGHLAQESVAGSKGAEVVGIGLHLFRDKSGNNTFLKQGHILNIKSTFYNRDYQNNQEFFQFYVDYVKYIPVTRQGLLAFNGRIILSDGEVPFQLLPSLGGPDIMRGIESNKYCDSNYLAFQCEYRFPVYRRWSGVTFIGLGDVADSAEELKPDKIAAGLGVRFTLDQKQNFKLRLDLGFGKDKGDSGIYFGFQEAF